MRDEVIPEVECAVRLGYSVVTQDGAGDERAGARYCGPAAECDGGFTFENPEDRLKEAEGLDEWPPPPRGVRPDLSNICRVDVVEKYLRMARYGRATSSMKGPSNWVIPSIFFSLRLSV